MKNPNSIMQEDYEESVSLTLRTWSSRKSLRMQEENWKHQRLQPCLARLAKKKKKKQAWRETRSKTHDFKSKFACILEASEFTRLRMEESLPNYHEDHIAGKGNNSLQHHNVVHKFIPMPQAMKIPAAKAAVDKGMIKIGENFGVKPDQSQK